MAIQTEPTRIQIPFADSGTKNVIPDTNSTPSASQAASWTDGFPAQCSLPLSAGGIPPARADFNGIFNTMSQSIRFGQEGGVWAWDATVDYAANRAVLGSDGLLYWSVAQSGPNVGGPQDPTADDGTYWSTMPMRTPPLADDSSKAASTEWVRDLAATAVYVDPAGSDANDGMSASTPVQTFSRALAIGGVIAHSGGSDCFIVAAAGSYAGNVDVSWMRLHVRCSGAITINGDITLDNQANLIFETSDAITVNGNVVLTKQNVLSCTNASSWTQAGGISVSNSSLFFLPSSCTASVTRNASIVISALDNSLCRFGALTVTSNGGSQGIVITQNAEISVFGDLTVNATNVTSHAISVVSTSFLQVTGNMYVSTPNIAAGQYSINTVNNSVMFVSGSVTVDEGSSAGFLIDNNSTVRIVVDLTITNSSNSATPLYVSSRSFVNISQKIAITTSGAVYRNVLVNNGSGLFNGNSNSLLEINNTSSSGATFMIECNASSWCQIRSLALNGRVNSASVGLDRLSYLHISSAGTVSGTVTVGQRFFVGTLSFLQVDGAGVNRIPGAQPGTVSSANFAVYG